MKKLVCAMMVAATAIISGNVVSAQGKFGADSAECVKYLSYYKEYYKQKNYDAALPNWRKAYKLCPATANQTMLIDGTSLMRRLIAKNVRNAEYKNQLVDTLMALHDKRAEFYPKYAQKAMNNKGMDLIKYKQEDYGQLYPELTKIIKDNGENVTSSLLVLNMKAAIELYKDQKLSAEEVIATYQNQIAILDAKDKSSKPDAMDEKIRTDMESLFITSKVASCDNLIALFTPRFEADPENLDMAKNIVKMMSSADDCTSNELYLQAATKMYQLEPSAQSAFFLFKLNSARGNVEEAVKYLEEAIASTQNDNLTVADYNYQLASFCLHNNMLPKAYEAAKKAAELDPSIAGKAYFLIGSIWSTVVCSGDEIAKRAKYWVATDYMIKAKNADESLASDCNSMIGQFSVYFPTAADAFMYNLTDGQSYTVSCGGMRAATTVRTQK